MPSSKRTLTKDEPNDKVIPCKRTRTSENTPAVTKDKRVDLASNVKSEDMSDSAALMVRSALSPKDLPSECLYGYRTVFRPAIRDLVGTLGPWEFPADEDVIRIWNDCFPKHRLETSMGLHAIVSKSVEDVIHHWRRDMATTAVEWVKVNVKGSFNSQSKRVAHAALLLGSDEKDRKRPFYYKKYEDGVQPSGIFQSPIIAVTLATHLSSISCLDKKSRLPDYPTGALALSILAAKRALTWAKTGVDSIPRTAEGYFSRANWGDHYRLEEGRYMLVKAASNIVAVINKLRDTHWERILAEANKCATQKNARTASKALLEEKGECQSDFELEDWDDDFE